MRDTGPSAAVRRYVRARDGHACKRCFRPLREDEGSIHHRQPRQMGGTKRPDVNDLAALALLCGSGTTGCHGWIESHRAEAYANGWLVHSWDDPAEVAWQTPVLGVTSRA
jgi:hypothetical protein